jgi:hypothetical protein
MMAIALKRQLGFENFVVRMLVQELCCVVSVL